jgi:PGF-pre-PGF domain-containing protein
LPFNYETDGNWVRRVLMPKSCRLFKSFSHRRKLAGKLGMGNGKPWRVMRIRIYIVFTVFSLLLSCCGLVGADYVMLPPPQDVVITVTSISMSSTTPTRTFFINVTEYDAQQIVQNITVEFRKPVTYFGFEIDLLNDRPTYAAMPRNVTVREYSNETVRAYYLLRFLIKPTDEITNVAMVLAVEKNATQKQDEEITLTLYRYNGRKMEEAPAEKFEEDDSFSYFKTTAAGSAYVAITRALTPTMLWWPVVVIIAIAALMAALGIYVYRRFKLGNLRKMVKI